jgi:hypothetical protein
MLKTEQEGGRKVILTKWLLIIFSLGTFGYLVLLGINDQAPPDSFFMNFVLGLGAIGGAFTIGNIFEHRAKADKAKGEGEVKKAQAEKERAMAEAEKAKTEAAVSGSQS